MTKHFDTDDENTDSAKLRAKNSSQEDRKPKKPENNVEQAWEQLKAAAKDFSYVKGESDAAVVGDSFAKLFENLFNAINVAVTALTNPNQSLDFAGEKLTNLKVDTLTDIKKNLGRLESMSDFLKIDKGTEKLQSMIAKIDNILLPKTNAQQEATSSLERVPSLVLSDAAKHINNPSQQSTENKKTSAEPNNDIKATVLEENHLKPKLQPRK